MKQLQILLVSLIAYAQVQTPLTVLPGAGTAPGEIRLRERRSNGDNYTGWSAPASLAADAMYYMPGNTGTIGECLKRAAGSGNSTGWGPCGVVTIDPLDYDWSQSPSANISSAGTHTITLTPGPLGVSATDTVSQYWIIGAPGASEAVSSTGTGTCDGTGQTSCTIQIVTANGHNAGWTIGSGSDGVQEAINSQASGTYFSINVPPTTQTWQTRACVNGRFVSFQGEGYGSHIALATANQQGLCKLTNGAFRVNRIRITGTTGTIGIYVRTPNSNGGPDFIDDNWFQSHATAIKHRTPSDTYIERNVFYPSTVQIEAGNELWADQGGLYIRGNYFGSDDSGTSKHIWFHGMGGSYIQQNSFLGSHESIYADFRMAVVDTNGTTITATGDYLFDSQLNGATAFVDGTAVTITYVSATQLTSSINLGVQSGVDFGAGSSQLHLTDNNWDNARSRTIALEGTVKYGDIHISNNHFQRVADAMTWAAIDISNENLYGISIRSNTMSNLAGVTNSTRGIYATATGNGLMISDNRTNDLSIGMEIIGDGSVDKNWVITGNNIIGNPALSTGTAISLYNPLQASIQGNFADAYNKGILIDGPQAGQVNLVGFNMTCVGSTPIVVDILDGVAPIQVAGITAQAPCQHFVRVDAGVDADAVQIRDLFGGSSGARVSAAVNVYKDETQNTHPTLSSGINDATYQIRGTAGFISFGVRRSDDANGGWLMGTSSLAAGDWALVQNQGAGTPVNRMSVSTAGQVTIHTGLTLPTGAVNGYVLTSNGSGVATWAASGACSTCFVTGGNSFGSAATLGTNDGQDLVIETNNTTRWRLTSANGHLLPITDNATDIGSDDGSTPLRVRKIWGNDVDLDGTLNALSAVIGGITMAGTQSPGFDGLGSIGTATYRYGNFYGYDANFADDVTISGTLTLPAGAVNGYVLTSDGSGNASWATSSCATCFVNNGNSFSGTATLGTNDNQDLAFETNATQRWIIQSTGHLEPSANNTYDIGEGTTPFRVRKLWAFDADFADDVDITDVLTVGGNATFSGTTNTLTGTLRPGFDGLGSIGDSSYRYGSIFAYDGNFADDITVSGQVASDLIPSITDTFALGDSTNYWNMVRTASIRTHGGDVSPATTLTGSLGASTLRWNNIFGDDLNILTSITVNGNTGTSATKTVRASGGGSDCTLVFTYGVLTGGTC